MDNIRYYSRTPTYNKRKAIEGICTKEGYNIIYEILLWVSPSPDRMEKTKRISIEEYNSKLEEYERLGGFEKVEIDEARYNQIRQRLEDKVHAN